MTLPSAITTPQGWEKSRSRTKAEAMRLENTASVEVSGFNGRLDVGESGRCPALVTRWKSIESIANNGEDGRRHK